jgi:hypothetical protein
VDYTHDKKTVKSQLVGFTVAGKPARDMCKVSPGWRWFGPNRR